MEFSTLQQPPESPPLLMPSSLLEPIWIQFAALLPSGPKSPRVIRGAATAAGSPTGSCSSTSLPALVHGSGDQRISSTVLCSATTIRRRVPDCGAAWAWPTKLHRITLAAYDQMIGSAPRRPRRRRLPHQGPSCKSDKAGPSPVDRAKQGLKRSTCVDAKGVPLGIASGRREPPRLQTARPPPWTRPGFSRSATCRRTRHRPPGLGLQRQTLPRRPGRTPPDREIAAKGIPAPIQVGKRGSSNRSQSWMNGYGRSAAASNATARSSTSSSTWPPRSSPSGPHPPGTVPLPLGHPTNLTPTPLNHLLAVALKGRGYQDGE